MEKEIIRQAEQLIKTLKTLIEEEKNKDDFEEKLELWYSESSEFKEKFKMVQQFDSQEEMESILGTTEYSISGDSKQIENAIKSFKKLFPKTESKKVVKNNEPSLNDLFKDPNQIEIVLDRLIIKLENYMGNELPCFQKYKTFKLITKDENGNFSWRHDDAGGYHSIKTLGYFCYFLNQKGYFKSEYSKTNQQVNIFLKYFKIDISNPKSSQPGSIDESIGDFQKFFKYYFA